ncbi:MAG: YHS domain protein [Saprospiraceae bacterium]|nr:YHS domain protein [Saprospiraceae bacterium]
MRYSLVFYFLILAYGQGNAQRHTNLNLKNGTAAGGYDVVSYFTIGKAVEGKVAIADTFEGVRYLFSSVSNRKRFEARPADFVPQYGGWCAYAMGVSGEKVEVDPKTFKIADHKLYLFYHTFFKNTLTLWNKDENRLQAQAMKNWEQLNQN